MTKDELGKYFTRLAKVYLKEKGTDINELVKSALVSGQEDFLGAVPWAFKERHTTVTTTASTESVELPDNFDGLLSVVEKETSTGGKLTKYSPDEYDRLVPDSAGQNEGTPTAYKIYFDGVWKLALSPTPSSAITLYITYHSLDGYIPNKFIGGLIATIAKYLYLPGSPEWNGAFSASVAEIERLKRVDTADVEGIGKVLDGGDGITEWSLEEYMRTGQVGA